MGLTSRCEVSCDSFFLLGELAPVWLSLQDSLAQPRCTEMQVPCPHFLNALQQLICLNVFVSCALAERALEPVSNARNRGVHFPDWPN